MLCGSIAVKSALAGVCELQDAVICMKLPCVGFALYSICLV